MIIELVGEVKKNIFRAISLTTQFNLTIFEGEMAVKITTGYWHLYKWWTATGQAAYGNVFILGVTGRRIFLFNGALNDGQFYLRDGKKLNWFDFKLEMNRNWCNPPLKWTQCWNTIQDWPKHSNFFFIGISTR